MKCCTRVLPARNHQIWIAIGPSLLALAGKASASPSIALPLNAQVPPVARVSKPFQFIFSDATFTSPLHSLQYVTVDAPTWLHLDSLNRRLYGTPDIEDLGPTNLTLVATDLSGSTLMPFTLIVSANPGPALGVSIEEQLATLGTFSSPNNLLESPSNHFSLSFAPNTFTGINDQTVYYAISANNTPLPSWISFDPGRLLFTGTTPSFSSSEELPQHFGIQLIASDVVGFSGAIASFQIIIESHKLTFGDLNGRIDILPGKVVNSTILGTSLTLDGQLIRTSDLKQIIADAPSWLSLDSATLALLGMPPTGVLPQNITVSAVDIYGDIANTTLALSVGSTGDLIQGSIGILKGTIGSDFNITFNASLFPGLGVQTRMDLGNTSSWLHYDTATLTLFGHVPADISPQEDKLAVIASQSSRSQTQNFTIKLLCGDGITSSLCGYPSGGSASPDPPLISTSPSSNPTARPAFNSVDNPAPNTKLVEEAILIPLVAVLGALLLFYWYCRRKRKRRSREGYLSELRPHISGPTLIESTYGGSSSHWVDLFGPDHRRLPSEPPKIERLGIHWVGQRRLSNGSPRKDKRLNNRMNKYGSEIKPIWRLSFLDPQTRSGRPDSMTLGNPNIIPEEQAVGRHPKVGLAPNCRRPSKREASNSLNYSPGPSSYHVRRLSRISIGSESLLRRVSTRGHGSGIHNLSPVRLSLGQPQRSSDLSSNRGFGHGKILSERRISGPPGFCRAGKSWRNTVSPDWVTINESTTSSRSTVQTSGGGNRTSTLQSFPRPPTSSTLSCSQSQFIAEAPVIPKTPDWSTIRPITSPTKATHSFFATKHYTDISSARQNYIKARRRHRESILFSRGPGTSRKSSPLAFTNHIDTNRSPRIPLTEDISSPSRRIGTSIQRSHSMSSTPTSPLTLSPVKLSQCSPTPLLPKSAPSHKPSKSSMVTSSRFESANESDIEGIDEGLLVEEETEEGTKRWGVRCLGDGVRRSWLRGLGARLTGEQGEGGRGGASTSMVLGGAGRRPVSVEDGLVRGRAGSESLRGDLHFP